MQVNNDGTIVVGEWENDFFCREASVEQTKRLKAKILSWEKQYEKMNKDDTVTCNCLGRFKCLLNDTLKRLKKCFVSYQTNTNMSTQCIVCMDAMTTHGFMHGKDVHSCVCGDCALKFKERDPCLVCKRSIQTVVRVF